MPEYARGVRKAAAGGRGRMGSGQPDAGGAGRVVYRAKKETTPTIVPCAGPCLNLDNQVGIPQTL